MKNKKSFNNSFIKKHNKLYSKKNLQYQVTSKINTDVLS